MSPLWSKLSSAPHPLKYGIGGMENRFGILEILLSWNSWVWRLFKWGQIMHCAVPQDFQEFQCFKEPILLLYPPLSLFKNSNVSKRESPFFYYLYHFPFSVRPKSKCRNTRVCVWRIMPLSGTIVQLKQRRKLLKWDDDQYFLLQKHDFVDCYLLIWRN